jgi:GNAT superfamily N-acetyltransferase
MNVTIRRAVKQDCPRLLELINELAVFERAPQEVTVTLEEFEDAGFGKNAVWKAFVAESKHVIHGLALYYTRYSTWKGRRLYLEDLIITEQMRNNGMGKLLFERVIAEAKEFGYNGMTFQVLEWNEPAIKFYNKYNAVLESGWLNVSLSKEQINN